MESDHLVLHVPPDQRIQRGERLVEQHQVRVSGQCAGKADALLHATGELVGVVVLVSLQADEVDHLGGLRTPLLLAHPAHLEAVGDVVDHLPVWKQTEVLEHHRDAVASQLPDLCVRGAGHVIVPDPDRARGGFDQPRQAADERRLAGTRKSHHDEDLAGRDVEGDVLDPDDAPCLLLEVGARKVRIRAADDLVRLGPEDLPQVAHLERRSAVVGRTAVLDVLAQRLLAHAMSSALGVGVAWGGFAERPGRGRAGWAVLGAAFRLSPGG